MIKRTLSMICVALLVFSCFVGCAKKGNSSGDTDSNNIASTTSSAESAPNPDDKILGMDIIEEDESSVPADDNGESTNSSSDDNTSSKTEDNTSESEYEEDDGLGDNIIDFDDLL